MDFGLNEDDLGPTNAMPSKRKTTKLNEELIESSSGLSWLFDRFVLDNTNKLGLKGKGNDLRDFNKIMSTMDAWHEQFKTKLSQTAFQQRLQKLTKDRKIQNFLHDMRLAKTGEYTLKQAGIVLIEDEFEAVNPEVKIPAHLKGIMCHKCGKEGHYAKNCEDAPEKEKEKLGFFEYEEDYEVVEEPKTTATTKVKADQVMTKV